MNSKYWSCPWWTLSPLLLGLWIVVSQSLYPVWLFATAWNAAHQASLSFTNRVGSKSRPLSWWCHPTISSSAIPFSSHLQSFPGSSSFPVSQFFASGGRSIEASASASALPMNIPDGFPLELTVWSPCNPRDSQESSLEDTTIQKH